MSHPSDVEIPAVLFLIATVAVLGWGGRWRYFVPHRHLLARRVDRWVCLRCPRAWPLTGPPPRKMGRI
jgi:hypothetical protein